MHQNQKTPFVKTVEATLEKHLSYDDFHVAELAEALYVSRTQLFRKLKQLTGHSPTTFIRYYRLAKGNHLLLNTQLPIKSISYQIGSKTLPISPMRLRFCMVYHLKKSEGNLHASISNLYAILTPR